MYVPGLAGGIAATCSGQSTEFVGRRSISIIGRHKQRPMRLVAAVASLIVCPLGCAHGTAIQKLDGNTYRVTCEALPLDRCLGETASNACDKHAYFVERGISEVNLRGHSDAPDVATSSEAIIRCSPTQSWGDQAKELMAAAPAGSTVSAAASRPDKPQSVCAPGSTQTCVGTGACNGGQACRPDGSGYERCDCGSPAPAPAPAPANGE
jgi:hypothetical protein